MPWPRARWYAPAASACGAPTPLAPPTTPPPCSPTPSLTWNAPAKRPSARWCRCRALRPRPRCWPWPTAPPMAWPPTSTARTRRASGVWARPWTAASWASTKAPWPPRRLPSAASRPRAMAARARCTGWTTTSTSSTCAKVGWAETQHGSRSNQPSFEPHQTHTMTFPTDLPSGNPFKLALQQRHAQVGLWLSMADPYLAEVSATAGFDWLLIDGEHAPNDLRSTLAALQAVAPYRAQPVVRAVQADTALIKQLLDIGVQNLLVPMVDTAEQAAQVVSATRYPPHGIRGVGIALERPGRLPAGRRQRDLPAGAGRIGHRPGPARRHLRGRRRGRRVHRPGRPGRLDGPPGQPGPPRGAGCHRGRHAHHHRQRQGCGHLDVRPRAGPALPGSGLHLCRHRRRCAALCSGGTPAGRQLSGQCARRGRTGPGRGLLTASPCPTASCPLCLNTHVHPR